MKCVLTDCTEDIAPERAWFCESHFEEATKWWNECFNEYGALCSLAHALHFIGTDVDRLVYAIEKPWNYAEEAYWYHTRHEHREEQ